MSTINDTDLLLVERNGVQYQITYDQMSTLNDDDLLLVERGGVQYKVEAQDISTGPNGLIIPPVEVLTPVNGAGITEFTSYEPVSSAITAVGEAGTIAKETDEILSVVDEAPIVSWDIADGSSPSFANTDINFATELAAKGVTDITGINLYLDDVSGYPYTSSLAGFTLNNVDLVAAAQISLIEYNGTPYNSNYSWVSFFNGGGYNQCQGSTTYTCRFQPYSLGTVAKLKVLSVGGRVSLLDQDGAEHFIIGSSGKKVLSFPTNTNFSGLSVGDVVQGSGIQVTGPVILYHWTQNISAGQEIYINGQKVALSASNAMQQLDITAEAGSAITSMEIHRVITSGGAIAIAGISVDGNLITGAEFASGWDPNIVWEGAGGAEATFDGVVTTVGQTYTGLPVAPSLGGLTVNSWNVSNMSNSAQITAIDASTSQQEEYATWNPLNANYATLSQGNLEAALTGGGGNENVRGTIAVSSGKYYWENTFTATSNTAGSYGVVSAYAESNIRLDATSGTNAVLYMAWNGSKAVNGTASAYGATYTVNDVIGVALDLDVGTITFYKNNVSQGVINLPATGIAYTPTFAFEAGSGNAATTTNFGATAFTYTPPSGYVGLSETVTTYPSVTVDGGDWDASNQSQVWSSQAIGGSLGSVDIAFNGEVPSLGSSPSGGNYSAPMTFEPTAFSTPGSVNSLVIYGARNAGSPRYIKVDGVIVPFTDNNTFQELTVNVTSFSSIVCEHNGTDGSVIAAIYVNGKLLVDAVEDSQVWTNSSSFTTGTLQAGQLSYAFDGDTSTVLESGVGGVWEVNFSTPLSGEVVVWNTQAAASRKWHVYVDGVDNAFDITPAVGYQTLGTFTNITKITQTSDHNGAGWGTSVAAIKIGGKLLIDAGIRDFGDRYLGSSISYEKSLTFSDTTELANMVTPLEMVDANGDVVTPVSDTIANVNNNVLTLQGNTNLEYFQPGDEVQTGVEIVSVDAAAPSITVDGGSWLGADGSGSAYEISKSLRFNSGDSAYLSRTPSITGSTTTWTLSFWIKRVKSGVTQGVFMSYNGSSIAEADYANINFNSSDQLVVGYAMASYKTTNRVFRDFSSWHHIVVRLETGNSTASDRVQIYVNGVKETSFAATNDPGLGQSLAWNNAHIHRIGSEYGQFYADCYFADVHFVDGQALAPTAFGQVDSNGVWQAKAYNGVHNVEGTPGTINTLEFTGNGPHAFHAIRVDGVILTGANYTNSQLGSWSSNTTNPGGSFDGNLTGGNVAYSNNGQAITWTSNGGLSYNNKVEIYVGSISPFYVNINGGGASSALTINSWNTIAEAETPAGVNGFHLDFSNSSSDAALGYDAAGSNDWTVNNLTAAGADNDSLVDTPTNYTVDSGNPGGNYATMNPLDTESLTLSNGNLDITNFGSSRQTHSTIFQSSGKWYAEFTITAAPGDVQIGVANKDGTGYLGSDLNSWGVISLHGNHIHEAYQLSYGSSFTTGDTIMVALDMDNGKWYAGKNGTWFNSGNPANGTNPAYTGLSGNICFAVGSNGSSGAVSCNFGARSFSYTPPTDFLSLCTTNLPDPIIKDGSDHFGIVTYTGNNSAQTFNTLGFSPDLVWVKARNQSLTSHQWFDTVRGVNKAIYSDFMGAEETVANTLTSFNSDGFTIGTGNNLGVSGRTYVAWCWNAGDTTETIAAGGLNSSVYDQSQTWSNGKDGDRGDYPVANVFDGSLTTVGYGAVNQTITVTLPGGPIDLTSLRVKADRLGTATGKFYVNGNDYTSQIASGINWNTITGETSITSIGYGSDTGSNFVGLFAVEVNGKQLVDYGVSASIPSIASEVRANPAAGFSIISYIGNNTSGATIGHGLNAAVEFAIFKQRGVSNDWSVYHKGAGATGYLRLNTTDSFFTTSGQFNDTHPSSSVITLGSDHNANGPSNPIICYAWAPVEGYSAFGSYTGNGSADGPYVHTGFKPAFLIIKRTDSTDHWYMYDNERNGYNPANEQLSADSTDAEYSSSSYPSHDFLSNGFKLRTTNTGRNASGGTYVYIAFAENPFNTPLEADDSGDTQVALDALVAAATEIVETDGTTMYLNGATGPWRTGLSIEGSQINAAAPGPSEITFTSQNQGTPVFSGVDATLASRTWTLESGTTGTGPWTLVDTYSDFGVLSTQTGATPWTENKPTLQPNTFYRIKVAYNSTNATSVESVYNTFKTGDA